MRGAWLAWVVAACSSPPAPPPSVDGIPIINVGHDAYLHLDALPLVHIGDRAYMRSTYDRTGGNEYGDASHFLRLDADGTAVALDVAGAGVLVFARANHWHGSPWHWRVDGGDHVVTESSTATPDQPVAGSTFAPAAALPAPLALTWSETGGADLSWIPVPFTDRLTIAYGRTHYGTGYFIYHLYPPGADHLSSPLGAWDEAAPPRAVLDLFARAGTDIAPPGDDDDATVDVPDSGAVRALRLTGPATIRKLEIDAPAELAAALESVRVVIRWDGREPSVDAPLALLFGAGALYDREGRGALVSALLANVTLDADRVRVALYFPMPFSRSAEIELLGAGVAVPGVHVAVRTVGNSAPAAWQGYFHATFVDHAAPVPGHDLVALDTTAAEGGGDWCGSFVGMSFVFSDRANLTTLEGDPRFFFDDAESPQAYGTGTEEWAGGGDYWGGQTTTLPLAGHPTGAPHGQARDARDAIESAYRFLIADAMPFGKNARIQLEHGALDDSTDHYRTVAYWYGRPGACLVRTDTLQIGDLADEAAHAYGSPTAAAPAALTSRWDGLGVDDGNPPATGAVRTMTGTSAFTVAIDPQNRGVLLRRKLDYAIADQAAEVWIADAAGGPFALAGTWYLAGSETCVYSNPPGELDPPSPVIESSGRRWREDELLVPRQLTEGRSSIRVEVRIVPATHPLLPGMAAPAPAWTEARYTVYSYVL